MVKIVAGSQDFALLAQGYVPLAPAAGYGKLYPHVDGTFYVQNVGSPEIPIIDATKWVKPNCKAATTANITLSGAQTIDGITCVARDRVLVKNQTTNSQNGIYVVQTGAWTRAPDASTAPFLAGAVVSVDQGTQGGRLYRTFFRATDTIGATGCDWWYVVDQLSGSILYAGATHAANHQPGGSDAMAVDAAIGTGSLRTLGAGAQQAMPGNTTLDVISAPAGPVSMNNRQIKSVLGPTANTDAATKAYVDAGAQIGNIVQWPSATPPTGWLLCNGQVAASGTYPILNALLGTTYGAAGTTPNIGPAFVDNPALTGAQVVASSTAGWSLTLNYGEIRSGMAHIYLIMTRTGATISLGNPNHAQQNVGSLTSNFAPLGEVGIVMANAPRWGDLRASGTVNLMSGLQSNSFTAANIVSGDAYGGQATYPMDPTGTLPKVYTIIKAL